MGKRAIMRYLSNHTRMKGAPLGATRCAAWGAFFVPPPRPPALSLSPAPLHFPHAFQQRIFLLVPFPPGLASRCFNPLTAR
ncbi:hypothetical protein BOO71_0010075 [Deinococcus marmoris]|uniref:Uncharacterized protein n=1 Tax=Deinococcus marmoris TaxID=249408 RepID=A0A1U7NW11_9DEIO|nr:hypothetical protein BOO71_0010075 [Deinococcus marmoris]